MAGHIQASPPERYNEISRHLLRQAQVELAKGDILQASEKAWGATAHAIKSVCQRLGWNHHAHSHLRIAAGYIATEFGRDDLHIAFGYQDGIHTNYYEHQLGADYVRIQVDRAGYFIGELAGLPVDVLLVNPRRASLPRIEREGQERRLRRLTRKTGQSHGAEFSAAEAAELPPVMPALPDEGDSGGSNSDGGDGD